MTKKLTKNQKAYQDILGKAEQQGINTQGLKALPKEYHKILCKIYNQK